VQFFLEDCCKSIDRKDVDRRVIDFYSLHMNVILNRFNAHLPNNFHTKDEKENNHEGRGEGIGNKRTKEAAKKSCRIAKKIQHSPK
jgi:hypothetical protein